MRSCLIKWGFEMRIRRLVVNGVFVTVALALVLLSPAASGASASKAVSYGLAGTATFNPGVRFCTDTFGCPASASGSATCASNCTGRPPSGEFSIEITSVITHPPSPCRVKSLSGSLSVTWSDATVSTAQVKGKFTKSQGLKLTGGLDPGNPDYPPEPIRILLSYHPPSPCMAASSPITGTLSISG
jgi:hypothetical protein